MAAHAKSVQYNELNPSIVRAQTMESVLREDSVAASFTPIVTTLTHEELQKEQKAFEREARASRRQKRTSRRAPVASTRTFRTPHNQSVRQESSYVEKVK